MNKKQYIYSVYNFLNNTKGEIKKYEIEFLLSILNCEKEYILQQKEIDLLNELLENGEQEERFYKYLKYILKKTN